jgi:hypothetical protein
MNSACRKHAEKKKDKVIEKDAISREVRFAIR